MVFCCSMVFSCSMVLCVVCDVMQHESCYFRQGRAVSAAKQCGAKRPGPLEPQRLFTATAFQCNGVSQRKSCLTISYESRNAALLRSEKSTIKLYIKNSRAKFAQNRTFWRCGSAAQWDINNECTSRKVAQNPRKIVRCGAAALRRNEKLRKKIYIKKIPAKFAQNHTLRRCGAAAQ